MTNYSNNHYNPDLKMTARKLRKTSASAAEKLLWKRCLSRRQMGERFLRQRSIDQFIVDFFAPRIGLIIEIDGSSHLFKGHEDSLKEERLVYLGYHILRLSESEVIYNVETTVSRIDYSIYCLQQIKGLR